MAEAANSSQLKEAFTGQLEQTEGHLRLLEEISHRILTDIGNSERVHTSTFDIHENALVVYGSTVSYASNPPSTLACKGSSVYAHFFRI